MLILLATGLASRSQTSAFQSDYFSLKGTIDKYPVTMHLHRAGDDYFGSYYYDRVGEPITLTGSVEDGVLKLSSFKSNGIETFELTSGQAGFTGSWQNGENKPRLQTNLSANRDGLPMTSHHMADSLKPGKGSADGPKCEFDAYTVWPTGTGTRDAFVKQRIRACLDNEKKFSSDPATMLTQKKNSYLATYRSAMKDEKETDMRDSPSSFSWDLIERVSVIYQSPAILCLDNMQWEYSGGAHGNGASIYKVLDLKNQKELKISDVIIPTGMKSVLKLEEKYLRKKTGLTAAQPLKEAGLYSNSIGKVSDIFYVTDKGVCFSYTPYDIGPYSSGQIEIFVPYAELKPYLQPGFIKLMGIK
jgi:hypothetical protein